MKCEYCKYAYKHHCSCGMINDTPNMEKLGCVHGTFKHTIPEEEKITKEDILKTIEKVIEQYEKNKQLVDVLFWQNIAYQIDKYLI